MGGTRRYEKNYVSSTGPLNRSQRQYTKEAIIKLLLLGPHNEEGIAEHFGLTKSVVEQLVVELIDSGRIICEKRKGGVLRLNNPLRKWWGKDPYGEA